MLGFGITEAGLLLPDRSPRDAKPVGQFPLRQPQGGPQCQYALAEGIVDAAAAGLLDGRSLVLESGSLTDAQLRQQLRKRADLVLTDSNRRRNQRKPLS